jgi:hypothetical protein
MHTHIHKHAHTQTHANTRTHKYTHKHTHTHTNTQTHKYTQAFIPETGKGIQGATSHCLGQNFSKMFDIEYETDEKTKEFVWQVRGAW